MFVIWSPTYQQSVLKRYHSHKHFSMFLPTRWRQKSTGVDTPVYTRLTALCPGLPGWAGTRKVKPIWILLKQETVSGSGIGWAICKSAPRSRQITMPAPHCSVFYRPDALPAAQPTASKHWRQFVQLGTQIKTQCKKKKIYKNTQKVHYEAHKNHIIKSTSDSQNSEIWPL